MRFEDFMVVRLCIYFIYLRYVSMFVCYYLLIFVRLKIKFL